LLKNTFIHIPGIGEKTEILLWSKSILSWDDVCHANFIKSFSTKRLGFIKEIVSTSREMLAKCDAGYFARNLHAGDHWRIFPEFREKIAYIDIETTGLESWYHDITTIALYSGGELKHYVLGENLDNFKKDIYDYSVLVTYNGKLFDIPFIENKLGIKLDHVHIDLRWVLKSLGITGGLKGCEKKLGIDRDELEGVSGAFAPELWGEYRRNNNRQALETLIAYNMLDVLNLEKLLIAAYNKKIENTPFRLTNKMPEPAQPAIPFRADKKVINKIRKRLENYRFVFF
jgi:uncharacterized protein YprB with RNaseH-like and TPR domain